jgi:acetyl esterase/lipase
MKHLWLLSLLVVVLLQGTAAQTNDTLDYTSHFNLLYAPKGEVEDDRLQRLNLFVPKTDSLMPLFIWIGGGAWSYVDKDVENDFARKLARKGIAVASVGHRLSPATWRDSSLNTGIQHPKHTEDIAAAIKWLYDHSEDYGYSPDLFFIGGYSSGAHLAALVSLDSTYLNHHQLPLSIIKGVVPISGTYDISNYHQVFLDGPRPELATLHVEAVFGATEESWIHASPVTYLEALHAPMLVICDNGLYRYTRLWEDRLRETDFQDVEVLYSHKLTHGGLWRNLSKSESSIYRTHIIDFIRRNS